MAAKGYLASLLNALPDDVKKVLVPAFDYVAGNLSLGNSPKAANFNWYAVSGTTSSAAGTEFSIVHGMDNPPSKFIPIMDLTQIGSQLVPLVVSRAPDAKRIYLTSASTSAVINGYAE